MCHDHKPPSSTSLIAFTILAAFFAFCCVIAASMNLPEKLAPTVHKIHNYPRSKS